ncbi:MAG: glycosyltransferase family 4 protein [Vicingaceae bacterium]
MPSLKIISSATSDLRSDQRIHRICASLQSSGWEVLTLSRKMPVPVDSAARPYQMGFINTFFKKGPGFYAEFNARLFWRLLFSRVDILLSNDLDTLPANCVVSLIRRIPLIYDSHEYFTEVPELTDRPFVRSVWKLIERICIRRPKAWMTVSKPIAEAYNDRYQIEMQVVRNLPFKNDTSVNVIPLEFLIQKGGKYRMIYQGSVNIDRGLEELLDAMDLLPDFDLLVCGDGDVFNDLKKKRAKLVNPERIIMTGKIDLDKLHFFTRQADIGISIEKLNGLSYTHSLPNKVFDYIQLGLPCLVSPLPEVLKLNEHYDFAHVIKSHEPREIAKSIKALFSDNEQLEKLRSGAQKASQDLNWENEFPLLISVFEGVRAQF